MHMRYRAVIQTKHKQAKMHLIDVLFASFKCEQNIQYHMESSCTVQLREGNVSIYHTREVHPQYTVHCKIVCFIHLNVNHFSTANVDTSNVCE